MGITAGMVKALRDKTGLPMMECKQALTEADGDEQKAVELLRKKGLAQLSKRASRETAEGRVAFSMDPDSGRVALIEVLCETEPVTTTEDFLKLCQAAAQITARIDSPTPETIVEQALPDDPSRKLGDVLQDIVNRIRENIRIGRVSTVSGNVGHYVHHDGRKGVLVEFSNECPEEVAADVCMHIVAMRPPYARREDVPSDMVESERALATEQVKGKPEHLVDKIVTGKLNRWYSEIVLLEQPFVKEEKKSVQQILREASPELTVTRFVRLEIGEG